VKALLALAVVVTALAAPARSQQPQSNFVYFVYFVTPSELALCVFDGDLAKRGYRPWLTCWNQRVRLILAATGTVRVASSGLFPGLSQPRSAGALHIGETWWGNSRGQFGKGRGSGRILYRCTSRESGLTCRSRSGHGFWLGRTRGYRVF